jgi:hypothetical protein
MATFYVGPRPVLRGVNTNDMVNPYTSMTGKAKGKGTYSYYPLYNTSQVLTGAPDNAHVPGTGYFPGDVFMSQIFRGVSYYIHPLSGAFRNGYGFGRFNPDTFKGLAGSKAFPSSFGHELRYNEYRYNNNIFDGVTSANVFLNTGHGPRTEAQGAPSSFGVFRPDEPHFVTSGAVFTATYGQAIPTGYNNNYGKNKVQEWRGLPSSKAL